jgi:hypothetical protein
MSNLIDAPDLYLLPVPVIHFILNMISLLNEGSTQVSIYTAIYDLLHSHSIPDDQFHLIVGIYAEEILSFVSRPSIHPYTPWKPNPRLRKPSLEELPGDRSKKIQLNVRSSNP